MRIVKDNIEVKYEGDRDKAYFVNNLATTGRPALSAYTCGLTMHQIIYWRDHDLEFDAACEEALAIYRDLITQEVERRAITGWLEPVFGGKERDQVIGHVRKFSDALLMFHAKRFVPEYREQKSISIKKEVNIEFEKKIDLDKLTKAELDLVSQLLAQRTKPLIEKDITNAIDRRPT